jgi:hypothetical protein
VVSEPEPAAPPADRLGLWWLVAAGLLVAVALGATGHPLRATFAFAGTCLGAGALRALLPKRILGALVVRRRWVDATILIVLGLAIGIIGRSMNLNPHV